MGSCFVAPVTLAQRRTASGTTRVARGASKRPGYFRGVPSSGARKTRLAIETNEELLERLSADQPRRLFRVSDDPEAAERVGPVPLPTEAPRDRQEFSGSSEKLAALHESSMQLRETVERLGFSEVIFGSPTATEQEGPSRQELSLTQISAFKCIYTAVLAWCFSWFLWHTMGYLVVKFESLGTVSDWYVVQRLTTVFRALIVASFAMGAGLSFFTGTGLLLLSGRVVLSKWQRAVQSPDVDRDI
jgi:hypothetical protein